MTTKEQDLASPDGSLVGREPSDETAEVTANRTMLGLAILRFSGLTYGIDMKWVREIRPFDGAAPVYGMPSFWDGVAALRGDLFAVLDLQEFLSPMQGKSKNPQYVVFTSVNEFQIGLLAGEMPVIHQVDTQSLTIDKSEEMPYVLGTTPDETIVLDLPTLFADPRLTAPKSPANDVEK